MSDLIDRQEAIDGKISIQRANGVEIYSDEAVPVEYLKRLPAIQPVATDTISKFIDGLEEIFADLRERHVDDSVCGLCEYDGAYIGESGDWCNECPGFNRDDCFKLSDKTRRKWTEEIITICKHVGNNSEIPNSSDCISRQAAIDALDCINGVEEVLRSLPPIQPEPHEGTWVYGEDSTADCVDGYRCSQCGFFVPWDYNHKLIDYINDYAYCPHCGTKMITK